MPIILQVTAWTILAVGFLALGHKFFPNFKQWFTSGKISYVWLIAITLGLFILLTYPYFFNWWAVNFWNVPESELTDLTKLGPLGDIYGSLNTIFTSATLAFVVYATLLQRQANQDARDAMDKQLRQVRNATRKQLRQARLASRRQLGLAQATHDAQIQESKHAIFLSMFNSLLSFKENSRRDLRIKKTDGSGYYNSEYIFSHMENEFSNIIKETSSALNGNGKDRLKILEEFLSAAGKLDESSIIMGSITSYLLNYQSLIKLVKESSLLEKDKNFYYQLVGRTMGTDEQLCFIWFVIGMEDVAEDLIGTNLLWVNCERYIEIINKFHDRSFFNNGYLLEAWDNYQAKQEEKTSA